MADNNDNINNINVPINPARDYFDQMNNAETATVNDKLLFLCRWADEEDSGVFQFIRKWLAENKQNIDFNHKDRFGFTCLHMISFLEYHPDCVVFILDCLFENGAGIALEERNMVNITPLMLAVIHAAETFPPTGDEEENPTAKITTKLLRHGANVNAITTSYVNGSTGDFTALKFACVKEYNGGLITNLLLIKELVANGATCGGDVYGLACLRLATGDDEEEEQLKNRILYQLEVAHERVLLG